jgi:protein arginine kinase activator
VSCERCASRPAKLKYTELREGKSRVLWICEECARELGFGTWAGEEPPSGEPPEPTEPAEEAPAGDEPEPEEQPGEEEDAPAPPASLQKIVLGVVGVTMGLSSEGGEAGPGDEHAAVRCEGCGITGAELRDRTLLGCPVCYETFARPLDDLLLRLHGALEHAGRLPGGARAVPPDAEELHRKLREAIERQDFEEAAKLRDRLRRLRGRPE